MKSTVKISPDEYVLSALNDKERLEAAFNLSRQVFKKTKLTPKTIQDAIRRVRKKIGSKSHAKSRG